MKHPKREGSTNIWNEVNAKPILSWKSDKPLVSIRNVSWYIKDKQYERQWMFWLVRE